MSMNREQLLQMQASARVYQARADSVFEAWGFRAPHPTLGEDPEDYRRALAHMAKKQLPDGHKFRKVKLSSLDQAAFEALEPQVYDECRKAATRPDSSAPGELREVKTKNPQNGQEIISFIGTESFVKEMTIPGRKVSSFMHRYDGSGRPLR